MWRKTVFMLLTLSVIALFGLNTIPYPCRANGIALAWRDCLRQFTFVVLLCIWGLMALYMLFTGTAPPMRQNRTGLIAILLGSLGVLYWSSLIHTLSPPNSTWLPGFVQIMYGMIVGYPVLSWATFAFLVAGVALVCWRKTVKDISADSEQVEAEMQAAPDSPAVSVGCSAAGGRFHGTKKRVKAVAE